MELQRFISIKKLVKRDYTFSFLNTQNSKNIFLLYYCFAYFFLRRYIFKIRVILNAIHVDVRKGDLWVFLYFLQKSLLFNFVILCELFGVDLIYLQYRFQITYILLSLARINRVALNIYTTAEMPIYTISDLYDNATWSERELFDMFGVYVKGQSDLRRLLTDYNFFGHPLRKDFPVVGFMEISYNYRDNIIVYHKVSLAQEMRIVRTNFLW